MSFVPVPRQKWIEPEQVSQVLGQAKTLRDKALLAVVYQLGLRRGEVRRVLRSDYDGAHIEFTRSKVRIKVKLWPRTKVLLDAYLATRHDSKDWLFMTRVKKAMSGQMVYLIYRAERIVNAIVAWNNGLLKVGRTPAEDVPLPWYWKFVAWAGRKCGIGLLQIVGFQMTISHYRRRVMTGLWS